MKRNISIVLIDEATNSFIEHEDFPDGQIALNSVDDEGTIDILLKVNELMLDQHVYDIIARRFSLNKRKLYITLREKNH